MHQHWVPGWNQYKHTHPYMSMPARDRISRTYPSSSGTLLSTMDLQMSGMSCCRSRKLDRNSSRLKSANMSTRDQPCLPALQLQAHMSSMKKVIEISCVSRQEACRNTHIKQVIPPLQLGAQVLCTWRCSAVSDAGHTYNTRQINWMIFRRHLKVNTSAHCWGGFPPHNNHNALACIPICVVHKSVLHQQIKAQPVRPGEVRHESGGFPGLNGYRRDEEVVVHLIGLLALHDRCTHSKHR